MIGLWSVALREELRHALVVEDVRQVERWTARYRLATVIWPAKPFDPFFNANARDDIADGGKTGGAGRRLKSLASSFRDAPAVGNCRTEAQGLIRRHYILWLR